ncbi:SDR family oxidoreductase [Saccharicrinis aurantiacus]|uniref:SDR family oxidoreductase n=1 Tax=Saccharicrinis aurantiacus TaxID=1849719 RepID=UPI000838E66D|nr:SDR family oxidoreductase [Saccharicrinis aurantiacus]
MSTNRKTVLITGCSSGFGRLTAKLFQKQGWNVVATVLPHEEETELNQFSNLLVTKLDVTNQQSISETVSAAVEKFGSINVLVNNAGIAGFGVFEQWEEKDINAQFEVNVMGTMRVTKEVLPYMRKQGEGVIINLSSLAGLFGSPFSSVYSAAKYAIEGFTDSLAMEYAPFNIKVKCIAPGSYNTNLVSSINLKNLENGDEQIRKYSLKMSEKMNENIENLRSQGNGESDPQEVANKIYLCATEETPVHNVSGDDAEAMRNMLKTMPENEFMKMISDMIVPEI